MCTSITILTLVHCEWGNWAIGECSVTCGGGIQIDSRQPLQEALFHGNPCQGEATREIECNADACPGIEVY